MATSSFSREEEKAKQPHEAKLLKSLSRFETRRLGQALVIGCSMIMLTFFLMLGPSVIPFNKFEVIITETEEGDLSLNQAVDLCNQKGDLTSKDNVNNTLLCPSNNPQPSHQTPICDFSDKRSDICDLKGTIRIHGNSSTITLTPTKTSQTNQSYTIKPHPRKGDSTALHHVTKISIKSSSNIQQFPPCSINHTIPAIIFSTGGYMGNMFHDFTDILIPLFITSITFNGKVQFLISDMQPWWVAKYKPYLSELSKYKVINFNNMEDVHCFSHVIVGLRKHNEMGIDPLRAPNSYSMADFAKVMRKSYGLERQEVIKLGDDEWKKNKKKPRLMIIARKFTRSFMNVDEIVKMVEDSGFEVVVAEPKNSNLLQFLHVVNSCDVIMGVHGAGLTNLVFLPVNAVVIQIVPLGGLENIAWLDFGRPALEMKLRYLQYGISEEESSLIEEYDREGPVFKDVGSIQRQGWLALRKIYLVQQNVRLDVKRFRSVLNQAIQFLH